MQLLFDIGACAVQVLAYSEASVFKSFKEIYL